MALTMLDTELTGLFSPRGPVGIFQSAIRCCQWWRVCVLTSILYVHRLFRTTINQSQTDALPKIEKAPGIPQQFDWVTARVNCNCDMLFGFLVETVEGDVEARNRHANGERFQWREDQDRLTVAIGKSRVVFRKQTDRIVVTAIDQMGNVTQLSLPCLTFSRTARVRWRSRLTSLLSFGR